jgi:hypothetical protein
VLAHQGSPKSAQRHKVLADAFKLTWIATTMSPRPRLILCLSDPLAAAPFLPGARSWAARAFQDLAGVPLVAESMCCTDVVHLGAQSAAGIA